jgi:diguanylate cyclase (GGDEF)-like protein
MNKRAWAYIWITYLVAVLLALQAGLGLHSLHPNWTTVEILFGLAIGAQLFKVEAPNHVLFYATPVFFFAGTVLLDPLLLFLMIAVAHLAEWTKERWSRSEHFSAWYLQPFNIAMFWIASRGAQGVYAVFHDRAAAGTGWELAVILAAAVIYVALNHTMLGVALVLARGVPWSESGITDSSSFVSDFVLLCVGGIVGVLWLIKPWFILPALAPIAYMYQALMIPRLKREAEMDAKTGLFNARHFATLFASELDRAQRFDRPLAVIMADLDHLRETNNTYGHLAGDAVLLGVANAIHATVRDYDIAARFGGEEFALLLPEIDEVQASTLAERLRRAVESTRISVPTNPVPLCATMSVGVACFPRNGRTTTELLHAADTAVYAAKRAGRNRVICAGEVPAIEHSAGALHHPSDASHPSSDAGAPSRDKLPEMQGSERTMGTRAYETGESHIRSWVQGLFVALVTLAGIGALLAGVLTTSGASPAAVGLLCLLGVLAELLEVDLFGQGTVSVSVGVAFTAALLTGVEGLACVSGVIALVHHLRQRRGINQVHRAIFNWAVHFLAGFVVVLALRIHQIPLEAGNLALLAPAALAAAIGYFAVETGLIAAAVALARRQSITRIWRANYQWLLPHYIVLCLMGLALSVTFTQLGAMGVLIFAVPLLMMHYVQRQYVAKSGENVRSLQRLNHDLMRAALHDHLTGLGNERGFQEALRREVRLASERKLPLVLARLNVDEFRSINQEVGRRHGDSVLVDMAGILIQAPILQNAFRLLADDFAVILPNTCLSEALVIAERVRAQVPELLAGATVSIGVAAMDTEDLDADLLNEQAITALSEAKHRGRNAVVGFEEIRDSSHVTSWAQAQAVRRLLLERRVEVVFQPIWDIDLVSVLGFEALTRPAKDYGLAGPQEAFDIASRIGRARELDLVCREAILERASILPPSARLFLNVAPESLEQDRLSGPALVQAVLEAGLQPKQVVLELTERSIVRPDAVVRQAQLLREYGFALALDDTGAGNAGLGVLSQLKVDFVKVDRSVVNHAATDTSARAVLAGIFALAHEMGAYVIAEGIETAEMLETVRDMSRGLSGSGASGRGAQGYLLGVPSTTLTGMGDEDDSVQLLARARLGRAVASAIPHAGEPMVVGW